MKKLNLGAGATVIDGFEPRDAKNGDTIYPLPDADGSVDEIRASHVLEHFRRETIAAVLGDWARVLKPGGTLKIAVPDFHAIAKGYLAGEAMNVQGYVMGGQTDANDYHYAVFDEETLRDMLLHAGLVAVRRWESEIQDCAALPISLNLAATKPGGVRPKISAVISMPRLGFNDFWGCVLAQLSSRGIELRRVMGVYWDRKLTQAIEEVLKAESPDWILTLDYDTVFTSAQLESLIDLAIRHPEADAIAPLQASRHHAHPMLTVAGADGKNRAQIAREELAGELLKIRTAHFGCTLIRAAKVRELPKPWLWSQPDPAGEWSADAVDADIWFWRQWEKAGNSLYAALRVPVGHADLAIRWPDVNLETVWQSPREFLDDGTPESIWR